MYNNTHLGGILLQTTTNGNFEFPEISQQKINDLFHGFEFIPLYVYDLLVLTKGV